MAIKTNYLLQLTDQLKNSATSELRIVALNKFLAIYETLPTYRSAAEATNSVSAGKLEYGSLYINTGVKPGVIAIAKGPKRKALVKDPIK